MNKLISRLWEHIESLQMDVLKMDNYYAEVDYSETRTSAHIRFPNGHVSTNANIIYPETAHAWVEEIIGTDIRNRERRRGLNIGDHVIVNQDLTMAMLSGYTDNVIMVHKGDTGVIDFISYENVVADKPLVIQVMIGVMKWNINYKYIEKMNGQTNE